MEYSNLKFSHFKTLNFNFSHKPGFLERLYPKSKQHLKYLVKIKEISTEMEVIKMITDIALIYTIGKNRAKEMQKRW